MFEIKKIQPNDYFLFVDCDSIEKIRLFFAFVMEKDTIHKFDFIDFYNHFDMFETYIYTDKNEKIELSEFITFYYNTFDQNNHIVRINKNKIYVIINAIECIVENYDWETPVFIGFNLNELNFIKSDLKKLTEEI